VGGDFLAAGALEYYALKAHGLAATDFVVDIGCGTGRLACQLARRGHQRYAGFDIVESAIKIARDLCARPEWEFGVTDGLHIPVADGTADIACFFSVFTHVAHEHTYLYLQEARRLLRSGGRAVFSFLEFRIPSHWTQFESAVNHFGGNVEPIVFLDRDAIGQFAARLGYEIVDVLDGDKPSIPIEEEVIRGDGRVMREVGELGQSIAVLRKG
jgi:SAM-dependent methyltransferase